MNATLRMNQYHAQEIQSATPEELIAKLYSVGISACHQEDKEKVRAVCMELISALNFDVDPEFADQLYSLYEFCLTESAMGNFDVVVDVLSGLREAWTEGVIQQESDG